MRVHHLTGATEQIRPTVCHDCVWWQKRSDTREVDKQRWVTETEDEFGSWGKVYVEDGRHVASLQYGPAASYPRSRPLPAGPASPDAVLITCAYLSDPNSPWALQSLFLACISECHDRRLPAVEAFGLGHAGDASFADRFLRHRTIFPRDFLGDYGFRPLRAEGPVELMRLELGGLIAVEEPEGLVHEALRHARSMITPRPQLGETS